VKLRAKFVVRGLVQGVCFRWFVCDEARRHGFTGWVRNCRDGTVELVAEGEEGALHTLLASCRQGPRSARVSGVDVQYEAATGEFDGFQITH